MKTKPFNLEEALAGKPVVTRDGQEVTQFHLFDCDSDEPLCCVLDGCLEQYFSDGRYYHDSQSDKDLFMKVETKTMEAWINIYPTNVGTAYSTEEQANTMADYDRLECRRITWEVEV